MYTLIGSPGPFGSRVELDTASVVVVRVEIGNYPVDTEEWKQFYTIPNEAIFAVEMSLRQRFAIFTDQSFITEAARRNAEEALKSSGDFKLKGGISADWTAPDETHGHVHLGFYGDAIGACGPLNIGMRVNVRMELSAVGAEGAAVLNPTLSPGTLRQFVKINHWKNDWDMALCLGGASGIWPYVGPKLMDEERLSWFEMVSTFLVPPAINYFFLRDANAGGKLPAPGPSCVRTAPEQDEFNCTKPFDADVIQLGGRPLLAGLRAFPNGILLRGYISWFERLGRSLLLSSITVSPSFRLDPLGIGCNAAGPGGLALVAQHPEFFAFYSAAVSIGFEREGLYTGYDFDAKSISCGRTNQDIIPSYICSARVRPEDDPLNVFAPYVTFSSNGLYSADFNLRVPVSSVPDAYFAAAYRYPCRILIQTSDGARIITIPAITKATEEEIKAATMDAWAEAVNNCYEKSKRWDPKWLIDPSDFYRELHRWDVLISGLEPGEEIALQDSGGQVVAAAAANREGIASMRAILAGDAYDGRLNFWRSASSPADMGEAEVDMETALKALMARDRPVIDVRQTQLLLVAEIGIDDSFLNATATTLGNRAALAVATRSGVDLYDLSQASYPVLLARKELPELAGIIAPARELLAWGRRGILRLTFDPNAAELLAEVVSSTPVTAVATSNDRALILLEGQLQLQSTGRASQSVADLPESHCLAASASLVLVGAPDTVKVFELDDDELRAGASYDVHNLHRMRWSDGLNDDRRFLLETSEGRELIDITEFGQIGVVKHDIKSPELYVIDRRGTGFVEIDRTSSRVRIFRVGQIAWH